MDTLDFIKIEKFCSVKDNIKRTKREVGENNENHFSDKGLICSTWYNLYSRAPYRIGLGGRRFMNPHPCLASLSDPELSPHFFPRLLIGFS